MHHGGVVETRPGCSKRQNYVPSRPQLLISVPCRFRHSPVRALHTSGTPDNWRFSQRSRCGEMAGQPAPERIRHLEACGEQILAAILCLRPSEQSGTCLHMNAPHLRYHAAVLCLSQSAAIYCCPPSEVMIVLHASNDVLRTDEEGHELALALASCPFLMSSFFLHRLVSSACVNHARF